MNQYDVSESCQPEPTAAETAIVLFCAVVLPLGMVGYVIGVGLAIFKGW